jgi:biopolymer transport protein ExbD
MDEFEDSDKHSEIVQPPLLSMIGIFSMLIIFLVAGTVIGNSTIDVPFHIMLPTGEKGDELQSAPQIIVGSGAVRISTSTQTFPFEAFAKDGKNHPLREALRKEIQSITRKRETPTMDPRTFYVVADKRITYKTLFDIISVFRQLGVETFLFVSEVNES